MNPNQSQLLTLIKLREGHLSDAEGLSVREQLASDSLLLQHWKTLSQLYQEPVKSIQVLQHSGVDAESVAAFVEDDMSSDQRDAFESECWEQAELLREVIAAYQVAHFDVSSIRIPDEYAQHASQSSQRMRDILSEQTNTGQTELADTVCTEADYLAPIEDQQQTVLESAETASSEPEPSSVKTRPQRRLSQKKRNGALWFSVAVAVVVIVILPTYFVFVHQPARTSITKTPSPLVPTPDLKPNQPFDVELAPELAAVPKPKPEVHRPPDSPEMIPRTPDRENGLNAKPLVAQKPQDAPATPIKLSVNWTKLAGIIGLKTDRSSPWKGILADGTTLKTDQTMYLELRTLPFSWLQGTLDTGQELVMDANSEIQLSIQVILSKAKQPSDNTRRQTILDLQLDAGKVAFTHLQAGDVLRLQQQRQEWLVEVKQDDTAIGFLQQGDNRRELMAFAGEVLVTVPLSEQQVSLKVDQMLLIKDQSVSLPLKLTGKQNWRSTPSGVLKLKPSLIERMNQSENLLASLMTVPAGQSGLVVLASTNLGFTLDPTVAVPRATSSPSEIQRTAAIEWLLAAKDNPTTRAVWNRVKVIENTTTPTVPLQTWFQMAQRKVPGTQQLLRELSLGLGAKQPLFVRQCSIHFLRQLTRQRFAEYDPSKPTLAAVNSVRQKLRRATGNTGRPSGNTNRRQR
ncbi:hypothetical protein [uncultured Gimesia sp.]|uniref:hypothetical protein n=1 Tax=uncultured Gimesia sp. TaxID=1678688 RepID=UPI0030D8CDCE|tara:strand:- start:49983 stop:52037 length:2055 start_codon:yes stop_codon:yes gene_type:complete